MWEFFYSPIFKKDNFIAMQIKINDSILLELLDHKHAAETFALINTNRLHLREWLPWVDNMRTADIFNSYIEKTKIEQTAGTDWAWIIYCNNVIAGRIGLHHIDHQTKTGAIGYWLAKAFEGKGVITKACKAVLHFGFTELGLERIEIKCATENYKSKAVPERLGFTQDGILPQAEFVNDKIFDIYVYALLKKDWLTINQY
jgi:ribosomal-protein-serine acetyltransferase